MRLILGLLVVVCLTLTLAPSAHAQDSVFDAIAAWRDGAGASVCEPDLDPSGRPAAFAELERSLYVPYGDVGSGRVIYVLTAPWCPFCRQIVQQDASALRGIELRLVVGDFANASDFPRYYRLATLGTDAVAQMFTGPPIPLSRSAQSRSRLVVDAMLINAHVLQLRYEPVHKWFQEVGEVRPGPFGFPAFLVPSGTGDRAAVSPILGSINLDAVRADGAYRMAGVSAAVHPFVQNTPQPSPIDRGIYTWPNGVRIQAYPDMDAPGFCFDGETNLFVVGALQTQQGLWAYVEALDLARTSGSGGGYTAHGWALVEQ